MLIEIVFFGAAFGLLIGSGALLRNPFGIQNRFVFLLNFCASILFFYVYFILKEIRFETRFLNYMYVPCSWYLGAGMYSLFSATVKDSYSWKTDRWMYFPGLFLTLLIPSSSLIFPEWFGNRPDDYFRKSITSVWEILFLFGFFVNLGYYAYIFWESRSIFKIDQLKKEPGGRFLLMILSGGASVTLILISAYLLRELELLYFTVVATTFYSVTAYLSHQRTPKLLNEIGPAVKEAYQNSRLERVDLSELDSRLEVLMEGERLFLQEDLDLSSLAVKLDLKPYQLTEYLNSRKGMNFSKFINAYRVQEAAKILKTEEGANILSVAYRSGFNSKATFNLAFKSVFGTSPREYLRRSRPKR
ncbi:helix-turn-helix domain-containing protein [Leptospira barantonii]|uniref:Transcriptional regulator n=1 Tax=Leptospira barantonii TaxID=2023184 RepID=A0ABX4NQZ4_9LEPT|nr:helix-turn-helix domain-containing protein [Leptospira barantonii]PJZ59255.1 transcriptional regulator [Leptospira barantonii]